MSTMPPRRLTVPGVSIAATGSYPNSTASERMPSMEIASPMLNVNDCALKILGRQRDRRRGVGARDDERSRAGHEFLQARLLRPCTEVRERRKSPQPLSRC